MKLRVSAGPPAVPSDRAAARANQEVVSNELRRVRTAAIAWRNGVGGLLVSLVGFGLIKGRSDIGELAGPYDVVVGVVLLAALLCGCAAGFLLLRAAHGRPAAVSVRALSRMTNELSPVASDHAETLTAALALAWGLALSLACAALLCAAVATTWYGPARDKPRIEVLSPNGTRCGEVVRLAAGQLTLKTRQGEITMDLARAEGLMAVASCA